MKKIGILGGMSWASTITYYRAINETIIALSCGRHCADIVLISFDSTRIESLIAKNDWNGIASIIDNDVES
jgi:aspartate racemase